MANKFSKQILQLLAVDSGADISAHRVGVIIGYPGGSFFYDNLLLLANSITSTQELYDFKIMVICLMATLSDDDLVELGFVKES